ncbi:hypothetical protein IAU60_002090 [Kwoniella sp. DSM 27419]
MSTTFILRPAASASASTSRPTADELPASPSLSLMPFALGPASKPYRSTTARTAEYFRPRPLAEVSNETPSGEDRREPGSSTRAAFRGRMIVWQYIGVPSGWKGVVLSADKRPDMGGVEVRGRVNGAEPDGETEVKAVVDDRDGDADGDDGTAMRRTTRSGPSRGIRVAAAAAMTGSAGPATKVRGSGQVALSRPRTRQPVRATQVKKRYRLDSDDDADDDGDDDDEGHEGPGNPGKRNQGSSTGTATGGRLMRTPSKRARTTTTPLRDTQSGHARDPVPEIRVQEPTPLKHPLPTPKKRLGVNVGASSEEDPLGRGRYGPPPPQPALLPLLEDATSENVGGPGTSATADAGTGLGADADYDASCTAGAKRAMLSGTESMDVVERALDEDEGHREESTGAKATASTNTGELGTESSAGLASELKVEEDDNKEEDLIPSPATEDDPPAFIIEQGRSTAAAKDEPVDTPVKEANGPVDDNYGASYDTDGPVRILRPTARFDGFMLYTPDAPLAGFRANELCGAAQGPGRGESGDEEGGANVTRTQRNAGPTHGEDHASEDHAMTAEQPGESKETVAPGEETGGIQVRKSWWRNGGAGEGGDEMVRAMGEWLGLCDVLNRPVYLDSLDPSDDEED